MRFNFGDHAMIFRAMRILPGILAAGAMVGHALAADVAASGTEAILFDEIPSVFGASKYEQRLDEAPSSVTLITADEIRRYGYRTLADVMRSVRGFYVTYDRNYSYIGARGFGRSTDYNSRVLLLIDGHPTNENVYGMSAFGNEGLIDVAAVDHIEVIRGSSSSLYGTNALFAVVNVVTRRGRDVAGFELGAEAASLETRGGRIAFGDRFDNGGELLLSMSGFHSAGNGRLYYPEYDDPATNDGIAENMDDERWRRARLRYAHGPFSIDAAYVKRVKTVPTASWVSLDMSSVDQRFNNPEVGTSDERFFWIAGYQDEVGAHGRLSAHLSQDVYVYSGVYAAADTGGSVINRDRTDGRWWIGDVNYASDAFDRHRVLAGGTVQYNTHADQQNVNDDPPEVITSDQREYVQWSLYAQDEWRFLPGWIANLGVRYDHDPVWDGTTNPRLALIHQITPSTAVKLLYGQSFRAPSLYEIYYYLPHSTGLRPERIRTTELVVEHSLRESLRAVASVYQYRMDDIINQQDDYTFLNTGAVRARGIELELEGAFASWLDGRVSGGWQRAVDIETDELLDNSPQRLAKLTLSSPLIGRALVAAVDAQYVGARRTRAGGRVSEYAVANLTFSGAVLSQNLNWSASVYNAADRAYADLGGEEHVQETLPQDGRGYRLNVQYEIH
jgi:iron complex outermembrane receptor protein